MIVGVGVGVLELVLGLGLLLEVAERVAAQRDELLLVPALAREPQLPSAAIVSLHERRRAADERVVGRERLGERPQLLLGGQPLHRLQPVHDDQPVGYSAASSASSAAKITELSSRLA